jgi:hypothetical protein
LRGDAFAVYQLAFAGAGLFGQCLGRVGMIIFALMIGTYSIGLSYLRTHRRSLPLILLVSGFAVIVLGHALIHGWPEAIVVPAGGLLIAVAHFVNYRCTGECSLTASPRPSPKERAGVRLKYLRF